jgi:hypothetical protein
MDTWIRIRLDNHAIVASGFENGDKIFRIDANEEGAFLVQSKDAKHLSPDEVSRQILEGLLFVKDWGRQLDEPVNSDS